MLFNSDKKNTVKLCCFFNFEINKKNKEHLDFFIDDQIINFVIDQKKEFNLNDFSRSFSLMLLKNKEKSFDLDLNSFIEKINFIDSLSLINVIITKIQNIYEICFNLKTKKNNNYINVIFNDKYSSFVQEARNISIGINTGKYLQMLPSNLIDVDKYIDSVKKLFKNISPNFELEVYKTKELEEMNMNLFLSVNKGTNSDAALLILKFLPLKNSKPIGMIGKGIMFDSGGYNIKPGAYMSTMNQDKAGASSVISTFYSLIKNNIKKNIIAFIPLCKNLINSEAMVVNDIYSACDGQTVEIINTDAEGRLTLADTIAYATKKYDFQFILTIATLTGITSLSFGDIYTPFWATNDLLINKIKNASIISGDYVWNMPFHKEYLQTLKVSNVADYVNSELSRSAGNSVAATFIKAFCKNDNFIHFDIAGTHELKKEPTVSLVLTLYNLIKYE